MWGAVGGAGAAIGVLLGGTLTELVDWRAIFLINLPVGIGVAVAAMKVVPADVARPQWRGLDLRGALVATASLGALVYALSQAADAGWTSAQTLGLGVAGLAGLAAFAALELRTRTPLLNISRLGDRGVGGGFVMMLAASAVLFGSFLLTSIYLQDVLGTGALETGLAFLPMAVIIGVGAHVGSHLVGHAGLRIAMAAAFALTAAGMLLLSGVDSGGSYLADVLPGMLVAGLGLGIALVAVALSVLTGAADDEAGMLSGLNTTGHEIGGSLGVAVLVTIATGALGTGASTAAPRERARRRVPGLRRHRRRRRRRRPGRPAVGGELPAEAARSPRASPSTRTTMPAAHRHADRRSAAPARGRGAQHRAHPRRRRRRARRGPGREHGRDRSPRGRGARDHLRALPHARGAARGGHRARARRGRRRHRRRRAGARRPRRRARRGSSRRPGARSAATTRSSPSTPAPRRTKSCTTATARCSARCCRSSSAGRPPATSAPTSPPPGTCRC